MTESATQTDPEPPVVETVTPKPGEFVGIVKRFNSLQGFGFLTVVSDGPKKGSDMFAHHFLIKWYQHTKQQLPVVVQG